MKLCAHCGQAIVGPVPQPTIVQPSNAGAAPLTAFVEYHVPAANAAAGGFPPLRIYDFTVHAGRAILMLVALAASLAFADAPAPSPKPKRPRAVATPRLSPSPEPFDLENPPTDPPTVEAVPAPLPSPSPTAIYKANARPFHVDTQLGALATLTGETGTDITPTFWVNADGPLAIGNDRSLGRLGARIGLSSSPGETINAADVKTYRAAEVGLWAGYVIGHLLDVDTTLVLEGGFASRLKGSADPAPLTRLVRSLGVGVRFDAARSNASLTMLAGFDEASASCDAGVVCTGFQSGFALMVYGQIPIVQGAVLFTGDATLSVGQSVSWFRRRDVLRIGAVVDPVKAVKAIRGGAMRRPAPWWLRAPGVVVERLYFDQGGDPQPPLGVQFKDPA